MGPEHTRRVVAGETLLGIAHEVYGDARKFHLIAAANGLDAPFEVGIDDVLVIPDLPLTSPPIQPYFAQVVAARLSERGNQGGRFGNVPAGKLLIVEDVSVEVNVTPNHRMLIEIQMLPPNHAPAHKYWIPLTQRHPGTAGDVLVGGRTVRWYAQPGTAVSWYAEGNIPTEGDVSIAVSGQLIDLE
ncbi:hypothetical protein FHT40_005208 [Mycolicibacterium sp. BK556]|uniref:LysM peptidoglycan-binding domain-containing protein n=1 Tax=Mycobacteriaceae TaxID=1762 RepID=UPI00105EB554|nr:MULTISPECIES: hypothetical protein [Mycobacteriaceae]MBB3605521.1 hypothetical protein [Mycolicibacterium sp. BK556]MBB3635982.1 hypothetical protein [Mycolicibacterium sp. BK607]MBB3753394.1 hypothetical protein [Mycolicibacterium sp. BK634]TDO08845.1 hypothetical protein EV580_4875 [Mycobacterium sp. BK086]